MKLVIFFYASFPSVNPSVIIIFITNGLADEKIKYRRSIFIGDFVGKLITNGMIVQIPTENSFSKYKDCGSEYCIRDA